MNKLKVPYFVHQNMYKLHNSQVLTMTGILFDLLLKSVFLLTNSLKFNLFMLVVIVLKEK